MLKIEKIGQEYFVSFNGITKLNIKNANNLKKELLNYLTKANNIVVLDLADVNFIDSSAFQVLIALLKTAELHQSTLDVINVSDDLSELFDLLNLSDVFQIAAN